MSKKPGLRTLFVVNPRSAGGKTRKDWPALEIIARRHVADFTVKWTEAPGHATALAREGLRAGAEMVVSVGGDGTNNEVVNGFFDEQGKPVRPEAVFGVVPRGTGCDFARGQGISRKPELAFARLEGTESKPLDVGRIEYTLPGGGSGIRHFVNIAGFGANGDVVNRVNRSGKKLGGFVSFLVAALSSLAQYKNPSVALSLDDGPEETAILNTVFVCNGAYCGGGMMAGPKATIDDGLFDVTVIGNTTRLDSILSTPMLYGGKIYGHKKARHHRVKSLRARPVAGETVLVESDGEQPGLLPATWTVLPGALRLK